GRGGRGGWGGGVVDPRALAEVVTGKLTTRPARGAPAAGAAGGFPADLTAFTPFPASPPGDAEAPEVVWPARGKPFAELLATMRATRERSRQSIEKVAAPDPPPLPFQPFPFGRRGLAHVG